MYTDLYETTTALLLTAGAAADGSDPDPRLAGFHERLHRFALGELATATPPAGWEERHEALCQWLALGAEALAAGAANRPDAPVLIDRYTAAAERVAALTVAADATDATGRAEVTGAAGPDAGRGGSPADGQEEGMPQPTAAVAGEAQEASR